MSSLHHEFRCDCGQLLCKGFLTESFIEIKCRRCKKINIFGNSLGKISGKETLFFLYDSQGRVVDVSTTTGKVLGYAPEEVIGKNILEIGLINQSHEFAELWNKARIGRLDPFSIKTFRRHKNGELVHIHERIKFLNVHDDEYAFVIYEELAKDIMALPQPLIYSASASPRTILNGPFAEINIEGQLIYVSVFFSTMLAYEISEMLGKSLFVFCAEKTSHTLVAFLKNALHSHTSFHVSDMRFVRKDSRPVQRGVSFVTTYNSDHTLRGFVIVDAPLLLTGNDSLEQFPGVH